MISKPEIFENVHDYGRRIRFEYENLTPRLEKVEIEALNTIIDCAYKEGLKDGILLHAQLATD